MDTQVSPDSRTQPDLPSGKDQDLYKIQQKMDLINKMKKYAEDNTISKHTSGALQEQQDRPVFKDELNAASLYQNKKNVFEKAGDFDQKSKFMRISSNLPQIPNYS